MTHTIADVSTTGTSTPIDATAVIAALNRVVDPCSNAIGEPIGLHEMGLAHGISIDHDAGEVLVLLRLTSPCCAYGPTMAAAAAHEIERLAGVRRAHVEIDYAAVWTPELVEPAATARLTVRRRRTLEVSRVDPHDWTSWTARGKATTR